MTATIYTSAEVDAVIAAEASTRKSGDAALQAAISALATRVAALEHTTPVPPPATGTPFLSRPNSPIISKTGSDINISNVSIVPGTVTSPVGIAISIANAKNVTITDVDIANAVGGIYLYNCTGLLTIRNVRSRNIGDGTIGSGHSNHIQFAECTLDGTVSGCLFLGGRTEDMVSIWHSGGVDAAHPLVVTDCHWQGLVADTPTARAWASTSGTGVILGDAGRAGESPKCHDIVVSNSTLRTPGQVGIQLIDGPGLIVRDIVIYGEQNPRSNNPMTSWAGNPIATVTNVRHYWKNPAGALVNPWFAGYGKVTQTNVTQDSTIDPATLAVVL